MDIAVPRETVIEERRVGLVPSAVDLLVRDGHRVFVEAGAGEGAGFPDGDYAEVGATVVQSHEEAFSRGQVVVKVLPPSRGECALLSRGQVLASFLYVGALTRERIETLAGSGVTAIAFELVEEDGSRPLVRAMSEVTAGRLPVIAGRFMDTPAGGRGIVIGQVPGVPPARIAILGAGTVGSGVARTMGLMGASVVLLDRDVRRLRAHLAGEHPHPTTLLLTPYALERVVPEADAVICAACVPGQRAPRLITREMVRAMRPGSLIIDVSIDHGGCCETSRPTTLSTPTFVEERVTHYCVPNIPSSVARSASYAFTNAALPYVLRLAGGGREAAEATPALSRAVYIRDGVLSPERLECLDT